jgi:hypothetical protein
MEVHATKDDFGRARAAQAPARHQLKMVWGADLRPLTDHRHRHQVFAYPRSRFRRTVDITSL